MKTAIQIVHLLCLSVVVMLLGRYVLSSEHGLAVKILAVICAAWAVAAGAVVGIWIKNTF